MVPGTLRSSAARALACLSLFAAAVMASAPMAHAQLSGTQTLAQDQLPAFSKPAAANQPARTRFLIGMDRSVTFTVQSLTNPNRVIIELPDVALRLPEMPGGGPVGLVQSFRAGHSGPGKTRIVIDVVKPVVVENSRITKDASGKAFNLALEIVSTETVVKSARKAFKTKPYSLGAAGLQPPIPRPAKRPELGEDDRYKPTIVIDPGHGGEDTGAVKNGAVEKDVVLAFAKVLRDKIVSTGRYRVLMTRDTDRFIPLDERREFGERNKAALFIAVHADYATTKARGATIYSLRENVANSLKRSAKGQVSGNVLSAKEVSAVKDASSAADVSTVRNILADLAQREVESTRERTSLFSRSVIEHMGETTSLRNKPDQQAAFRVLKTAQFPSVLIELAYVTNKEDAALLKSDAWREKVADSISTAVENYFSHQMARLPM